MNIEITQGNITFFLVQILLRIYTELLICSHPLHFSRFSMVLVKLLFCLFPSMWSYITVCARPYILFISKKVKLCVRLPFCLYFPRLGSTTRECIPLWSFSRMFNTSYCNVLQGMWVLVGLLQFKCCFQEFSFVLVSFLTISKTDKLCSGFYSVIFSRMRSCSWASILSVSKKNDAWF
jgi:hypothetical protein